MGAFSNLQSWFAILGLLIVWFTSLFAMARRNQKKDDDTQAAITKVATDIDRVGERVNTTNTSCSKHEEAITGLRLEQQQSRDDRNTMREKVAGNAAAIAAIREEIQQERLQVMSTLHANERAAAERDAVTREQLATIRERLNIEQMVTTVMRNLKIVG